MSLHMMTVGTADHDGWRVESPAAPLFEEEVDPPAAIKNRNKRNQLKKRHFEKYMNSKSSSS